MARSSSSCAPSSSAFRFCTSSMASFSFCHSALRRSRSSWAVAISRRSVSRRSCEASSFSFMSACSSICICVSLRSASVHLFGHGVDLDAQATGRLVHEVDGLVGQEAIGDVAVGKLSRGHDGAVGDAHAVMDLVLLLQAAQDGDGVLHRGLAHQDGLEPAFERRILLDVLAVLVQRGRADGMQLAARESRLQHVARIQRAIAGGSGAHDGVQLVDEQDDAGPRSASTSRSTAFRRSSNSPRYFAPAIIAPRSSDTMSRSLSDWTARRRRRCAAPAPRRWPSCRCPARR